MNKFLLLSNHFLQRTNRNTEQQVDRMLAEWYKPQTTLLRSTVWGRLGGLVLAFQLMRWHGQRICNALIASRQSKLCSLQTNAEFCYVIITDIKN